MTTDASLEPDEGIERSLAGVFRGLSGGEPACTSTHTTPDGKVYRCAGVTCPMFPGQHKAWLAEHSKDIAVREEGLLTPAEFVAARRAERAGMNPYRQPKEQT